MARMRWLKILLAALMAAGPSAEAREIRERTLRLAVKAGGSVEVGRHFRFDRYCVGVRPRIVVAAAPMKGALRTREAPLELKPPTTEDRRCQGRVITAVEVVYDAAATARGEDTFRYERLTSDDFDTAYTVTVVIE